MGLSKISWASCAVFRGRYALLLALACFSLRSGSHAQHLTAATAAQDSPMIADSLLADSLLADSLTKPADMAELPDAPQPALNSEAPEPAPAPAVTETVAVRTKQASKYRLVVRSDEVVPALSGSDKIKLSVMSRVSPIDVGSTVLSAGWSHLRDSDPHYGTDKGAFGERLGALALKQTTQSFFTYGLYAGVARQDPRYYVMGSRESIQRRAIYSATRLVVARTDSGRDAVNWPKLAGIASATALTTLYYPKQDHGQFASRFGMSLATSVLTNELHEFLDGAFHMMRPAR